MQPKPSIEPSKKITTTSKKPVVVPAETVKKIQDIIKGTALQGITEGAIREALKVYNPKAHAAYQPETTAEGVKRILQWMVLMSPPLKNPSGFLIKMARDGMDKPAAVARAEQEVEVQRQEAQERRRRRREAESIRNENISSDIRKFVTQFCGG